MRLVDPCEFNAPTMLEDFSSPSRRSVGDRLVIDFLSDVSREILRSKTCRTYPDVITFGYFCRKSSMLKALQDAQIIQRQYGWGLAVHIAPSNVPVNFAFSFVFGLLSGNNNLVRLPSSAWPQVELLLSVFKVVSGAEKYKSLMKSNIFVRTERDSQELQSFILNCDALIVWGGDTTVDTFRKLNKKPRCVELYFPDRKSSLVIDAGMIAQCSEVYLKNISSNFFNDTYLVDNNACSSPRRILWVGKDADISIAKTKFWASVDELVRLKQYNLDVVAKIDKYLDIMRLVEIEKSPVELEKVSEDIWLVAKEEAVSVGRFGWFSESSFDRLDIALESLLNDEQTLTYAGFDKRYIEEAVLDRGLVVDRIVPMGAALDIGFLWDGVNVLQRLSRIIEIK